MFLHWKDPKDPKEHARARTLDPIKNLEDIDLLHPEPESKRIDVHPPHCLEEKIL